LDIIDYETTREYKNRKAASQGRLGGVHTEREIQLSYLLKIQLPEEIYGGGDSGNGGK